MYMYEYVCMYVCAGTLIKIPSKVILSHNISKKSDITLNGLR